MDAMAARRDTDDAESEAKRRKIRKGTRSCWECKRRKMKCIFGSPADATCVGCRRRGTKCVGQDLPEEISAPLDRSRSMSDRVVRVENLLERLIEKTGNDGVATGLVAESRRKTRHGIATPGSMESDRSCVLEPYRTSEDVHSVESETPGGSLGLSNEQGTTGKFTGCKKYGGLSRALHRSLPSQEDTERIFQAAGGLPDLFLKTLTLPYSVLEQDGLMLSESSPGTPGPDAHPILMARHMLRLAIFLQHLHSDINHQVGGLAEPPRMMMTRLADTAIDLATTKDELLGSIEGLECIMMESYYQANLGNLRRSWVASRRAMVNAQLMGLHRSSTGRAQYTVLDPETKAQPQLMWFRIVYYDRHLCLMLGFPQGSLDRSMASDLMLSRDTPLGRLERIHCVLASRILERQEEADPTSSHDLARDQRLDLEMRRVARDMPSKWWLTPNLDAASANDNGQQTTLFWNIRRLFEQLFHYNLLIQLHLPSMLPSTSTYDRQCDYSRVTCMNAAREVLSRYIVLRNFDRSVYSCRTVDFLALMAAITLLLAHLDNHRRSSPTGNLLAHQSLSDRAMMEQARDHMEEVNRLNADAVSAQSADLLGRLLAVESEAANGHAQSAESVSVHELEAGTAPGSDEESSSSSNDDGGVRVYIPYFGIIKIAREGIISKEMIPRSHLGSACHDAHQRPPGANSCNNGSDMQAEVGLRPGGAADPQTNHHPGTMALTGVGRDGGEELSALSLQPSFGAHADAQTQSAREPPTSDGALQFLPHLPPASPDPLLQQYEYPALTAGVDDWAFQGVDMALFDTLMRGAGNDGDQDVEWATWQGAS